MRLTRIYVEAALSPGTRLELRGAAHQHLARVLRLQAGATVTLFNGDGADYLSNINELRRDCAVVMVRTAAAARAESPLPIALVQGIARGERMDLVVQKATELGVAAIQPVVMERSVVRLDAMARLAKLAHWRGVAIAACEQCGRARLPVIGEPLPLTNWLGRPAAAGERRLQLDPDASMSLVAAAGGATAIELLIGPEGGLGEKERDAAQQTGYLPCRLGPRVLRSETAAIAALAVLQAAAGDLA
ncbi:MAG: 16S rRNA (uracil(1498)-N(3))-methyltransferase [Gammaproteobacteria bacterium]